MSTLSEQPAVLDNGMANGSMAALFSLQAQRFPKKQAIWCEGEALTYRELAQLTYRWSHAMRHNGVERGDRIAVLLPNSIDFVALMLAATDLGIVLAPLSPSLTPSAFYRACQAAQVKHLVSTANLIDGLLASASSGAAHSTELRSLVGGLWISVDEARNGVTCLSNLLMPCEPALQPVGSGRPDDAFILTMTSGSTGDPKPIILTQATKLNRAIAAIELYGVTENDKTLAATPLYHSLAERLVLIPLLTGGTSVLMRTFSVSKWLQCISQEQVTFTIAVSSQLKQIAGSEELSSHPVKLDSLRAVVSSSALLEHDIKTELLKKFNCDFHECYGASEIAIASNLSMTGVGKLKSVGTAAPGVDIKILGKNDQVLGPGEAGEIVCKTPMLFGGYFNRPDLTKAAMWNGYFRTGDTGKLDEDGYLYFLGRNKDIIISGGINIYPPDIESVVNEFPSIVECAAFAFPDARLGEVIALALVVENPATFDLRQLRFHCCDRLADFQQPRKFFTIEALPRNEMGKVMKFQLANMFSVQNPKN